MPLTQYDGIPQGYRISNFPSIVRVLNLVSIRVAVIFELYNSLLRYSKTLVHIGSFFTVNGIDCFNDNVVWYFSLDLTILVFSAKITQKVCFQSKTENLLYIKPFCTGADRHNDICHKTRQRCVRSLLMRVKLHKRAGAY